MANGKQYNCKWGPAGGLRPLDYEPKRWARVSATLKGMSDGAILADPTARKAMGTAGWGHMGAFSLMRRDRINWDVSVWHVYRFKEESYLQKLAKFNRPIWITEFNNPNGSQKSEQIQARGLAKIIRNFKSWGKKYNIEAAHVYELMDESYWAPDFEGYMGLVRMERAGKKSWRAGRPKAAYHMLKQLISKNKK